MQIKEKILPIAGFLLFISCFHLAGKAQNYNYVVEGDSLAVSFPSKAPGNDAAFAGELRKILFSLYDKGYLTATIDTFRNKDKLTARIITGKPVTWVGLNPGNLDGGWLNKTGYHPAIFRNKTFNYKEVSTLLHRIVNFAENQGYPFASVFLDSIRYRDGKMKANLRMIKGPFIKFEAIIIKGSEKVSPSFLANYLGIRKDKPYEEKKISDIRSKLSQLLFLNLIRPPEITFFEQKARVTLYLEDENASRLNGILGVLPGSGEDEKVLITGEADLQLNNAFGKGAFWGLRWEKTLTETQELNIDIRYPFLFSLPLGITSEFDLLKFRNEYRNLDFQTGLQYLFKGNNYVDLFYHHENSRIIDRSVVDTLPGEMENYSINSYGLGINIRRLDYIWNPKRGFILQQEVSAGIKKVFEDSTEINSNVFKLSINSAVFFPLGGRSVIRIGALGKKLVDDNILRNQLFRFGGINSFRGVNDRSILADAYLIGNIEYRFLTGIDSYLRLFTDIAWYEVNVPGFEEQDVPIGFGAGYSFRTKAGVFSVSYAFARQFENPVDFSAGKIHFGFTGIF